MESERMAFLRRQAEWQEIREAIANIREAIYPTGTNSANQ
jgi:hypothetical protein